MYNYVVYVLFKIIQFTLLVGQNADGVMVSSSGEQVQEDAAWADHPQGLTIW